MIRRLTILFCLSAIFAIARADLPAENLGRTETIPLPYPAHWIWAQDVAFGHMMDGKMILLDADADTHATRVKGMFNNAFVGAFTAAATRPEVYVAETFYERINRGKRTDVVTIYDKSTLAPKGEIVLPGEKRAGMLPGKYALRLLDNEKFLLVYGFTPATSVIVIDIVARKVVGEIPLPSCALIYPTGTRGFSSLCSDASMLTVQLDERGGVASRSRIDPFFDIQKDALFEKPVLVNGIGYFPTFLGNMQEIDLSGDKAVLGDRWSLLDGTDQAENWRPGGVQFTAADAHGNIYIIMHKGGHEGTHKDGGQEVWVFDSKQHRRLRRIVLDKWGISVEVTRDDTPLLVVVNAEMNLDVYDAASGKHLRTLADFGQETPLVVHAVQLERK